MSSSNDLCSISMSQRNSDDLPETTSSDKKGPVLSFHNVSYHVKEKKGFPFDQKTTEEKGLWNIKAAVFFILMAHQCFSSVSAVKLFVVQKQLFLHEHISGYYWVSSYFFGNILSDLLARRFLPSFIFTFIVYFMVAVETFFIMIFTLMMVAFSSISMSLAIGISHSDLTITRWVMDIYFMLVSVNWASLGTELFPPVSLTLSCHKKSVLRILDVGIDGFRKP
uniref:broad substrate specificity ATP-binding cassette transporter ABCG2-like n=1 Tax=Ictidomys tridecemlineatus TaxID=43179 RepID=UPI001A9F6802|nr:broad substrate specificity ATP-binding cassette transporter ABCG2-like [Ictidomys tridecemlineatus]